MKIQTIFEAFEQFKIGHDSLEQLYTQIVAGLEKVGNKLGLSCAKLSSAEAS